MMVLEKSMMTLKKMNYKYLLERYIRTIAKLEYMLTVSRDI